MTPSPSPSPSPSPDQALAAAQGPLLAALSGVHQLCLQAKDRQNASLQLHARLHQVFLRLAAAAQRGGDVAGAAAAFAALLGRLRRVLEQHLRLKNAVLRLLASRRLLAGLKQVHAELSGVVAKWQLASPSSAAMRWKPQLAVNVHLDEKTLHATLAALLAPASTFVAKEFAGERRQLLVLMELVCEFAPERERWEAHSPQLLETLRMTHRRITTATGVHVRRVPRWFLPRAEVVCADRHRLVGRGSFGSTLFRGDYFGVDVGSAGAHAVAIKYLWPLRDVYYTQVEHVLAQTLQQWWHISHPNVAQVRGACHVAAPPYVVRDYTAYGSLTAYVAAVQEHAKNPKTSRTANVERVTWELLYGAGKGLLYLHEQMKVVHGGLRCNNILVNKYGQPVIADYGLRALACEVQRHSMTVDESRIDDSELVRWLAPECLPDDLGQVRSPALASDDTSSVPASYSTTFSYASDVYAFGMCIVEAVTGAVPWSDLETFKVRSLKQTLGVLPPRPKRIHSNVWGLVQRMCTADPKQRISLRDVLAEIKELGYFGYGNKLVPRADSPNQSTIDGDASSQADPESSELGSASAIVSDATSAAELAYQEDQGHQDADFVDLRQEKSLEPSASKPPTARVFVKRSSSVGEPQAEESITDAANRSSYIDEVAPRRSSRVATESLAAKSRGDTKAHGPNGSGSRIRARSQNDAGELTTRADEAVRSRSRSHEVDRPIDKVVPEAAPTKSPGVGTSEKPVVPALLPPVKQSKVVRASAGTSASQNAEAESKEQRSVAASAEDASDDHESVNIWSKNVAVVERVSVRVDVVKVASEYHDARGSFDEKEEEAAPAVQDPVSPAVAVAEAEVYRDALAAEAPKSKDKKPPSIASTVEPELEVEAVDGPFFDARKSGSDGSAQASQTKPADEAPLSLTSELRNRISSVGRGGNRGSFLDTLLRATTLRTDEYMTARETSDPAPPLSTPKYVDLVEVLKGDASPETVLQALQVLRNGLRRGNGDVDWTERGGFAALFKVISTGVSVKCTYLALEILVESAVQNAGDIEAMVECGAVKILLAFIARSTASEELDLVASFLLEILASSDAAKEQLWRSDGIKAVDANANIDRRLVQEVKSIMAKYKSSEGYKHMNLGEYDLAIERFTEAIALDRKRATYYCDRSLAYFEASLFKKAADDAARCMRYNPYDVIGYLRNGVALKALGRYNEAIVCLRKGRQVDPKFAKIRDVISEIEDLRRGRSRESTSEEASVPPEEVVKAKKKDGDDALRKKQYDLAVQCYTEALSIDRRNDLIYLHRSIAHCGGGMFDKAIEDASRCIQINYRHSEGYYRLALALNSVGQFDQALRTLYRGQEIDSRHAGIRRFIQQLEQEEARRAGLDLPSWFKEKGYQAFQLRSYEEAIKFYSKGIAASKSDHDEVALHCFFYRARANQCRGEFGAVVMDCTHILHHNPKNVFARLRRADAYEQQRDYFMALQDMQELVMFNPDFESARARLESLEVRCRFLPRTNLQHVL